MDWDFAPCLCVARNDRRGRTYESFGEVPQLPVEMSTIVDGLQGRSLSGLASIMATAKHYIGDGGTTNGTDRGEPPSPRRTAGDPPAAVPGRGQARRRVGDDLLRELERGQVTRRPLPDHRRAQG
jgi:Glycosyl hydrolase family 3 N terminal domain